MIFKTVKWAFKSHYQVIWHISYPSPSWSTITTTQDTLLAAPWGVLKDKWESHNKRHRLMWPWSVFKVTSAHDLKASTDRALLSTHNLPNNLPVRLHTIGNTLFYGKAWTTCKTAFKIWTIALFSPFYVSVSLDYTRIIFYYVWPWFGRFASCLLARFWEVRNGQASLDEDPGKR
jgi:hypothetical protein